MISLAYQAAQVVLDFAVSAAAAVSTRQKNARSLYPKFGFGFGTLKC